MSCPTSACASCGANAANGALKRLGIRVDNWDFVVALAGNPNTGKSTIFNSLTGLRQHTGNWPGKTVTRAEGGFAYEDKRYKLVDLPGTYSLLSGSPDEEVARDFILFGKPDVTVIVADAGALERNLNLCLQILQITPKAVLALNLMDEAKANGLIVNERQLSRELGIPVIPMAARQGEGISELLKAVAEMAQGQRATQPRKLPVGMRQVEAAVDHLARKLRLLFPGLKPAEWVALRLLSGDKSITEAVSGGELGNLAAAESTTAAK